MSRGLEALIRLQDNLVEFVSDDYHYEDFVNDINLLRKELKVLEIIKDKIVMNRALNGRIGTTFIKDILIEIKALITLEEYDLLKEVLL